MYDIPATGAGSEASREVVAADKENPHPRTPTPTPGGERINYRKQLGNCEAGHFLFSGEESP